MPTKGSPIVLANIGLYSGPAASTFKPILDGAQLWVRFINAKGGLAGHEVKLLVYDDGGDPARSRAQAKEAIEQRNVLAFLANAEAFTNQASMEYIASKGVPLIGSEGSVEALSQSPMYFPQMSSGETYFATIPPATAELWVPAGVTKIAVISCLEAQPCKDFKRTMGAGAAKAGLQVVYSAEVSISQPDYTAECLGARNAGAQGVFVVADGNSVQRFAASCTRQGFRPNWATAGVIMLDRFKDDPNLDGIIGSTRTVPYFATGTPRTDEFQSALRNYGGGITVGGGVMDGWVAGKVLEKAGATLAEPATREALLKGLWSIKNDTLDGLTSPLTYNENKPATRVGCWFNVALSKGKWLSPDGFKLHCAP